MVMGAAERSLVARARRRIGPGCDPKRGRDPLSKRERRYRYRLGASRRTARSPALTIILSWIGRQCSCAKRMIGNAPTARSDRRSRE